MQKRNEVLTDAKFQYDNLGVHTFMTARLRMGHSLTIYNTTGRQAHDYLSESMPEREHNLPKQILMTVDEETKS